ncbi:MAG: Fic family protein [Proteobacteria bacterium]|nr:Fic family protein [Pseudomonadota bacterium]
MNLEDYFYPGTSVLRNNVGLTDPVALAEFERDATSGRDAELRKNPIPGNFDLKHIQAIHKHLFQDVYPWAGELRGVELTKGRSLFTFKAFLQRDGTAIGELVRSQHYLRGLDKAGFAERLAEVYARLSILHPFRRGNGLAIRAYLTQLAHEAGYRLMYDKINRREWNLATKNSTRGNAGGLWIDRNLRDSMPTERIIARSLQSERALAIENWPRGRALAMYPELDGAMGTLDAARRTGGLRPAAFEVMIHSLHEGHLVAQGTHDQSLEAVQLAAQSRGMSLHNASGQSGIVEGYVIGVSSYYVLVRVDDATALYYECAKLDRAVYANDRVSILASSKGYHVFEKGRELMGTRFSGRGVEKIDFSKSRANRTSRYNLCVTLDDGSVQSLADIDRRGLKKAFGERHANFLAAKAEKSSQELRCREPLPPVDGERVIVGQTYTGPILLDGQGSVVQLTNDRKVVIHERAHLSWVSKQFQVGDKVSISYPCEHMGFVRGEHEPANGGGKGAKCHP